MILQSLKMAWKSIVTNKMRSFLTMLGIIIGVIALVVLVSLANGATKSVTDEIASLGSNLLTVSVTDDKGNPIKLSSLREISELEHVKDAAPYAQTYASAGNKTDTHEAFVYGTTSDFSNIQNLSLYDGRFIKNIDVKNHSNIAVINASMAKEMFGRMDAVGQSVKLNGTYYLIVGVLEERENAAMYFGALYEAYIPYTTYLRFGQNVSSSIDSFCVSAVSDECLADAEAEVKEYLTDRFGDEEAFEVINQSQIMEAMSSVTNVLAILLGGIAAISLLVGGIGIMNIMLVSVTERTREIGIRKAIGAGRGAIMMQFLIEALMISLIGCMIGILFSWLILIAASSIASGYNLTFHMSGKVVLISVIFSTAIGLLFGLYPANKAAKKNPIEALRYMG